ncbi:Mrr restriction endonuclease-like protein [Paraburkholderia sp. BL18I3N2]|uniref:restriction endonuclease n=1 Tax=Paraburkholderia sp. BL18I3N2 TaxID=1938799 RepID=UPI000D3F7AE4|nr:hypothetical protein [Paraburkholderia sp. BL18I3N2]PRX27321.1 Mrr restriction endonuclease-like protein [Paraburkholderia sp. BL18I3N2]
MAKQQDGQGGCAIQCNFYETPIQMSDLANFFTLSGKGSFTQRMIIATTSLSKHAAATPGDQPIPAELLTLETAMRLRSTGYSFPSTSPKSLGSARRDASPAPAGSFG